MNSTDYFWLGWIALFAAIEGYAIIAKRQGRTGVTTLTDMTRAFMQTSWQAKAIVALALVWLALHFFGLA